MHALPADAIALAFAASVYPVALAAVIALGRGSQVRSRVFAFVAAAFVTTYAEGVLALFLLEGLGATKKSNVSVSAGVDLALGLLLLALALRLQRKRPHTDADQAKRSGPSKIDRYLRSRRLAAALGFVLYVAPSVAFVGAAKSIADTKASKAAELLAVLATAAVMLWMILLPMLVLVIIPARAEHALDRTSRWFAEHGRTLAIVAATAAGAYLSVKGLVRLAG